MAANVEKLHPQASLDGYVDAVTDGKVFGWAWDRERPTDRLEVTLTADGATVAVGLADQLRTDLAGSGIGDGAHAFALDLPEGTEAEAVTVNVRSATTGAVRTLPTRPAPQLETMPEELQRVTASVHSLQQVQKQTATAVLGVLREIRQNRPGDALQIGQLEEAVADIASGQQALMKRFESIEVFLLRFDTLLRQFDEKLNTPPVADKGPGLQRLMIAGSVVAAGVMVAAVMI